MASYTESGLTAVSVAKGAAKAAWREAQALCPSLTDWGVKTLGKGLDGKLGTIVVEPHYVCKDYRDLYSRFYSKKFLSRPSTCSRLHFFSRPGIRIEELLLCGRKEEDELTASYLGYSVIQPIREHCLGRTVLDPGKIRPGVCCLRTKTRVHLNGVNLTIDGYPYMSQSGEPTVCAHAALWGICRYLSDRYPAYAEVHPYDLIEMTGSAHGRRVPYRGMTYVDYCEILSAFGCHPVFLTPRGTDQTDWTKDRPAYYDIYAYLESGFPVLTSFRGHVATMVGHNLNSHLPPNATEEKSGFYNSFSLVKQFIVVDDNFFPYQPLGFADDQENYGRQFPCLDPPPSIDSIFAAVVPLPEKAFLPPDKARSLAYDYFHEPPVPAMLSSVLRALGMEPSEPLIARTFLTSSMSFKRRKRECLNGTLGGKPDILAAVPVDLNLPHFIWVMEVSPLCCYNKGLCIAEVALDASSSEDECEYIYLRVGNTVLRVDGKAELSKGLAEYPQYTHNLGERKE